MKKLILAVLLFSIQLTFSQNIKSKQLKGVWQVTEVTLHFSEDIDAKDDKIAIVEAGFIGAKFYIGSQNRFKIEMNPEAEAPFDDAMFAEMKYWNFEAPNSIQVGNDERNFNLMHFQVNIENDSYYFSLLNNIILKVDKISKDVKLPKLAKTSKKYSAPTIVSKPLVFEEFDEGEVIPFADVEEFPRTNDCSPFVSSEEIRKCVSRSIAMHVNRKFNTDLAADIVVSGKIKIKSTFIINAEGTIVNIKSESPHKALSDEATRIINLIPQLTPATHNGEAVAVEYSFPIVFQIQN